MADHFLRHTPVRAGRRRDVVRRAGRRTPRVAVHDGAGILATAADKQRIVTGGDDGKLVATNAKGETEIVATDPRHRWIIMSRLGRSASRLVGRQDCVAQAKETREFEAPSSVGGLAFLPKGFRLALAHYNGATLWFSNARRPRRNSWMEGVASRRHRQSGRPVSGHTMQERMLHGWRLADRKHTACSAMPLG